ncbi:MAG TPA: alpha-2-macroglobulin family protein, partial [Pyrinomonadaceae bacterium]|nr:alpha-2-macroglobulin family protein [Pyrinomonadaceae bacterium]
KPAGAAIEARYKRDYEHPVDQASLERILSDAGIDFSKLVDPWGQNYKPYFSTRRLENTVSFTSLGPDKKLGTTDDFTIGSYSFNYFTKTGKAIDKAALDIHARTDGYIRDLDTLSAELAKLGFDRSYLKDRWGHDYRITFEVSGRHFVIRVYSFGPNGTFDGETYNIDDFEVWKTYTDYFAGTEREINRVLSEEVNTKKEPFPRTEQGFTEMLRRGGLDVASIKDGYGRPVYVVGNIETQYTDKTKIEKGTTTVTPTTQEMMMFRIRGNGADPGMVSDDPDLAIFSGAITEAHRGTGFAKAEVKTVVYSGAKGAISGVITDPNGAVIPNATVSAIDESDETKIFTTTSDADGNYLLANLPSGRYRVRVDSVSGFNAYQQANVQVRSQSMVELNVMLAVAGTSAVVDVTAAASEVQTSNASAMKITTKTETRFNVQLPTKEETSTPRLREYFPESLVWQPELLTDKKGKAELSFKMADNITTWKMFAIATNKKGKVGVVEKEIVAFQSFFADLDPPKFLTEGDEIHLPTQVRNYTEKQQKVDVTMDKAAWFSFLGENKQQIDVANGKSQNAVFGFKALSPVKAGKQRVTAIGQSDSDAIEKPVTVRPNGEEIVRTESKVFESSERFDINFPSNALANTQRAELKIYPNLFSHVSESVEGMLQRPYGCGEQTISSTYPNVMILKFIKSNPGLREKAEKFLQKGYERLIGYQVADGGFTYWGGRDSSDVALTAYALRFLNDAKEFIEVDNDVIRRAENWLISQQRADGSWTKKYGWEPADDPTRTKLITTYVARSLAMSGKPQSTNGSKSTTTSQALLKALTYLKTRNTEIDEPYALALFGLASLDAGDAETAKRIATHLEKTAIAEGSGVYWKLETNTPFYGWGTAGRVETTALVLQLLTRVAKLESRSAGDVASKGLLFLLKKKDRYGVWYSTQTTINVLDAFLATLAGTEAGQSQSLQVAINGVALPEIAIAPDKIDPVTIDLRDKLTTSSNAIEVRGPANSTLMAQTVATHYIDWRDSQSSNTDVGTSRALRLDYKCDKGNAAIMEEVSCSVEAERIGFKGYGMLLAEIGTPPGAEVSRESLEAALEGDWSLSRYDVLPDRVVFYMWSKPGGTKFNFKFKPRYGINAQTPASIVYDYYNPEAHATVTPLRFSVK